ncbi:MULTISPECIES: DNA translocase FtsK [Bacillus]|uniref:DNA translocase FtsK n=1 Tax=Bacillus TaxID=1386 RepID=UPI0002D8578A|nr:MULTISPECIES: DNA translocase FtsK [Bacillus]
MKWLKKLKKWFKADAVYEIEEIILQDDEELDLKALKDKGVKITNEHQSQFFTQPKKAAAVKKQDDLHDFQTKSKDINAKINYQYPKGEFRFPLPIDQSNEGRKKPKVNRQNVNTHRENNNEKRTIKKEPVLSARKEVIKEKKRPFRPTETPSPVYGFQQRPLKQMEEEKEQKISSVKVNEERYSHATKEKDHTQADSKQIYDNVQKNGGVEESKVALSNDRYLEVETNKSVSNENIIGRVEEVEANAPITEKQLDKPEMKKEFSNQVQDEMTIESDAISQIQLQTEQAKHYTATAIEQDTLLESVDEELTLSSGQEEVSQLTAEHTESPIDLYEEAYLADSLVVAPLIEEADEKEQSVDSQNNNFVEDQIDSEKDAGVAKADEANYDVSESASLIVEDSINDPIERPKKKHIPFNVVMLRQDKAKLNKQTNLSEKKTIQFEEPKVEAIDNKVEPKQIDSDLPYYQFPSLQLLHPAIEGENDDTWLDQQGFMLNETLHNFNVRAKVVNITQGPAVTQFEVQPEAGVKVNKITNLTDDIKLCLAAQDIRMEAPIPGKHTIGIEIPNRKSRPVFLREILDSPAFLESSSPLTVALGLDITGSPVVTDLRKMPHGLIAGATGSGKSVCINTMLVSLLYKATPQELKVLLIDPKMVELAPYNDIPHLVSPVITDVKAATASLKWAVDEMESRYEKFAHAGVRDIGRFNKKAEEAGQLADKMPYIVIVIDELADLMMMSPAEVEESICRIAQKARACGIHLIVATQRPSVDVITGLIKANIPTRIAFSVSSQVDSRTIIDSVGAEKLLGRGDMLFLENGSSKTVRLQGTFVSDEEIEDVVNFVKKEQEPQYLFQQDDLLAKAQVSDERDELFFDACEFIVDQNAASTSSLQRRFHIGYNRAARLIDMMESHGIVSEARGSKPRDVLMTKADMEEWVQLQEKQMR